MRGFRVWSKSIGKYIDFGMMISQDGKLLYMDLGHESQEVPSEDYSDYIVEFPTGLKDKNGEEIYEGDIVGFKWTKRLYVVTYRRYDASFILENDEWEETIHLSLDKDDFEVVGNIHENPELLEEEG